MLTLNVPNADPSLTHTVETRHKTVADWLLRLPFASPADTGQQLLTALYSLNRHQLSADDRNGLLTLYRPVVERAVSSLEAQYADSGVPPHPQQRQIGTLLRELLIELSVGYKQVLLTASNRRFGRTSPKRTAEVVARLMSALRDIQTACYLTYTPIPAGLWQEMHQIHAYAVASDLADNAVGDATPASLAYCQALLIALADPPHMSHDELLHTRLYLNKFASLSVLATSPVNGHHGFFIQNTGDAPPSHFSASQTKGGAWLDTEALCRHLHATVLSLRKGDAPSYIGLPAQMDAGVSLKLCKRLLKQWSSGAQRAFKRYPTPNSTVQVVAGLSAIHRILEIVEQAPQFKTSDDSMAIHDVGLVVSAPIAVNITQWTVSNDSASGLALRGMPEAPLNLKVGDALALRTDETAGWSLGVIRWTRMLDSQEVALGVERLSPSIQPVWVHPLLGHNRVHPEVGLLLPGLAALKQNDRLLLPLNLYKIGMDADVWHPPHQYTLTFGRMVEHTPSFDLVEFSIFSDEPT